VSHPLVDAARALGPVVRAQADENERLRRLADPLVAALRPTGLLRMLLPAAYGGPEADPLTMIAAVEELAFHDGAAGWCVMISATTASQAAFLPPDGAREVFGDPQAAFAGAYAPSGKAIAERDGWLLDGRWMWGSGSSHAAWLVAGAMTDAAHHLLFFPAADAVLHDTWYASGLRGTGSGDFSVSRLFVPRQRVIAVGATRAQVDSPLARFPNFTLLALGTAAVTLGIARRAHAELIALAAVKTPAFAQRSLANHPPAQLHVAQAEAKRRSADAFLREAVSAAWDLACRGTPVPVQLRARMRLACTHAATEAAAAVDLCYNSGGGSAVFATSPLQRCFRDVHTATQHIMLSDRNLLSVGRLTFGLETDTSML
jgi:alkylation response protein AidB-like acyl-CoA dehydrogenase